jgi:hypothetical protein
MTVNVFKLVYCKKMIPFNILKIMRVFTDKIFTFSFFAYLRNRKMCSHRISYVHSLYLPFFNMSLNIHKNLP